MATVTEKIRSITKKQHYHLNHIIKKFSVNDEVFIAEKSSNLKQLKRTDDNIFIGSSSWSHEAETIFSHPIENKAIGQVLRALQGNNISDHSHLSDYHLLWQIRYFYAHNKCNSEKIYADFTFGEMDQELKNYVNYLGKLPINGDGSIDSMYVATQKIKAEFINNREKYKNIKWRIYKSDNAEFHSPDCYENQVLLPVSPNILLAGSEKKHKPITLTSTQVDEFNMLAQKHCHNFYFGKPST